MRLELDLTTARLFVAVVEEGSIAGAARRENIAASAISKRIAEVESHFEVQFLNRRSNGVELSEPGIKFLRRARNLLQESAALEAELRDQSHVEGHIRISANETVLRRFLPAILGDLLSAHPGITVDLEERNSALDVVRAVEQQVFDLGFFVGMTSVSNLEVRPCFYDRIVAVLLPDHPLSRSRSVSLDDILKYEVIGHDRRGGLQQLERGAAAVGRHVQIRVRADGHDVVCGLVKVGLGIGIISEASARSFAPAMNLVVVNICEPWAEREHRVCFRKTGQATQRATLLLLESVTKQLLVPSES